MDINDVVEAQLRESQKMDAIGRLAGGVAHDFNNLLTVILTYCEFLDADTNTSEESRENVAQIKNAAERASTLTRQLLAFSRQQILQLSVIDLNELLDGMHHLLLRLLSKSVKLEVRSSDEPVWIRADKGQIQQVIVNLCVNSSDAMPNGGRIIISVSHNQDGEVLLCVTDNGSGVPDDVMPHIFDPFYTTKPQGRGTGLGLATVYGIVKQLGGRIDVTSKLDEKTSFIITFPAVPAPLNDEAPHVIKRDELQKGTETVLLIEDNEFLRRALQRMLEQLGYSVVAAVNGPQAIEIAETFAETIDLVISDAAVPDFKGVKFTQWIHKKIPSARLLLLSSHTDAELIEAVPGVSSTRYPIIHKPFTLVELAQKLRDVLA